MIRQIIGDELFEMLMKSCYLENKKNEEKVHI